MSQTALGAKPAGSADASQVSSVPKQAGLVLATLIIVAAVANLPLAMANVALPSIGAYFDASQTQLNLVAVAYSLGLACSVLWLGALGDRYGRKMMAVLGVTLAIPAALDQRLCADHQRFDLRPALRRLRRRHGLSDHTLLDCGVVGARAGPHALDCVVGGHRRRDLGVRPAAVRPDPGGCGLAVGLLDRPAAGRGGAASWR